MDDVTEPRTEIFAAFLLQPIVGDEDTVGLPFIERVDLFDVYEGKGVPEGQKSLAIAVRLQPKDRTLTEPEIEAAAQKIVAAVAKATGGSLRG